jgi:hypothetical protein
MGGERGEGGDGIEKGQGGRGSAGREVAERSGGE